MQLLDTVVSLNVGAGAAVDPSAVQGKNSSGPIATVLSGRNWRPLLSVIEAVKKAYAPLSRIAGRARTMI
jgi:hypothetical protein